MEGPRRSCQVKPTSRAQIAPIWLCKPLDSLVCSLDCCFGKQVAAVSDCKPAAGMGPQEAALAGLHADALALLTRIELELGQANQQALAQRHQQSLGASLDKRHAQSAIWGKTTAAQQRLEQTRLQKVKCYHAKVRCKFSLFVLAA